MRQPEVREDLYSSVYISIYFYDVAVFQVIPSCTKNCLTIPVIKHRRILLKSLTTCIYVLTLRAPITTAADNIHNFFSLFFRENKT